MRPKTGRKRGAQAGNHNALKHGFYSKSFTKEESLYLDMTRLDNLDEIKNLRVRALRVGIWLDSQPFNELYFSALNLLNSVTANISNCIKSQVLISGKSPDVDKAIEDAMMFYSHRWAKV